MVNAGAGLNARVKIEPEILAVLVTAVAVKTSPETSAKATELASATILFPPEDMATADQDTTPVDAMTLVPGPAGGANKGQNSLGMFEVVQTTPELVDT
jgi:hypothetical protein